MTSPPAPAPCNGERELFIYYRVPADRVAAVCAAVQAVQQSPGQIADGVAHRLTPGPLRRRPGQDARGDVTLMEVYGFAGLQDAVGLNAARAADLEGLWAPLEAQLKGAIEQAAGQPVARHLEWFELAVAPPG